MLRKGNQFLLHMWHPSCTLITNIVTSHEWEKDCIVITANGTYSFVVNLVIGYMWNNSTTKYWCTSLVFGTKYVQLPILQSILVGSVLLIFFWVLLCVFTFWVPCFCDVRYHFRIKTMFGSSLLPVVCRRAHAWITFFVSFLRIVVFNTYCVMLCQIFVFKFSPMYCC